MFRTEVKVSPASFLINHQSKILTMGSCFADVIGTQLSAHKFNTLSNPFGIVYNPTPLFQLLNPSNLLSENLFVNREEYWYNYATHSELHGTSREGLEHKIKQISAKTKKQIEQCDYIILTFGTAFNYIRQEDNAIIANCHKMQASLFRKELSEVDAIVKAFKETDIILRASNKNIKYILTVSPVRHIKDTLALNNVSKSILRLACHKLSSELSYVNYFPAFEIMTDDLRDYRFYKEDMIHPSELAEKYIWKKFQATYMNAETININNSWAEINKAIQHKPFHPSSKAYQDFLSDTISKTEKLAPYISIDEELGILRNKQEHS